MHIAIKFLFAFTSLLADRLMLSVREHKQDEPGILSINTAISTLTILTIFCLNCYCTKGVVSLTSITPSQKPPQRCYFLSTLAVSRQVISNSKFISQQLQKTLCRSHSSLRQCAF